YPLTLNSLRLACNQSTNRHPVVDYDERTIREALQRLAQGRWTRLRGGPGNPGPEEPPPRGEPAHRTHPAQMAVLAVLMLRGAQPPGEVKSRTERMHPFPSLEDVQETLAGLAERRLALRLDRAPGQKEERWLQTLGGDPGAGEVAAAPPAPVA